SSFQPEPRNLLLPEGLRPSLDVPRVSKSPLQFSKDSKLLAYDIRKIHPSWTGRFVPKITLDDLLQGALTENKTAAGYNSTFFYPKKGGIATLISALIKKLFTPITYEHEVAEVNIDTKKVYFTNGTVKPYDYFVSTMPLNVLLQKLRGSGVEKIAMAHRKLLCNTVMNYNIGVNYKIPCQKHWIYFPEKKYRLYRVGFWSNVSHAMAPEGASSLYGECSFLPGRITEIEKQRLLDESIEQTCKVFDISSSSIIMQKNLTLQHAYVLYDSWREKNLPSLLSQLKEWNIHSIGRFGEWKYSSMQEAVLDGRAVVDAIEENLATHKSKYISKAASLKSL
ncbi:FAD-dependent oxidoreductase, partial [Candidatus Babeliales bacterium]|nr:FAD-dependent oxidoreductase [Candidatus Babeliales bacterium]